MPSASVTPPERIRRYFQPPNITDAAAIRGFCFNCRGNNLKKVDFENEVESRIYQYPTFFFRSILKPNPIWRRSIRRIMLKLMCPGRIGMNSKTVRKKYPLKVASIPFRIFLNQNLRPSGAGFKTDTCFGLRGILTHEAKILER